TGGRGGWLGGWFSGEEEPAAAIFRGEGHRRAVSYPGRAGDRHDRSRQTQGRTPVPEPFCRRRGGGRNFRQHGGWLSVRKRPSYCDRSGASCWCKRSGAGFGSKRIRSLLHGRLLCVEGER